VTRRRLLLGIAACEAALIVLDLALVWADHRHGGRNML